MIDRKRFGIALSGGGYRAAAYHLGTLKKLHELKLLAKVDVLSTISGGSITGAAYCLTKLDFPAFEVEMVRTLSTKSIIKFVLTSRQFLAFAGCCLLFLIPAVYLLFTRWAPISIIPVFTLLVVLLRFQFRIFPVSKIIERAYDRIFFHGATLTDLCTVPEIAIGATNLQTSRPFTFSKRKMEDSFYAYRKEPVLFDGKGFPVSRAVMASSCVPFAFTPVTIEKEFFKDYELAQMLELDPKLVDGGVYDNQGIQKLTQSGSSYACDIVLVSDAGNKLPLEKRYNNTFALLLRTVDTFMIRIKNFQMAQNIYQKPQKREVAYQSLGWDLGNCIGGFVRNMTEGKIPEEVFFAHEIRGEWIENPAKYELEIICHLNKKYGIEQIVQQGVLKADLGKIRRIGTNLIPLNESLVKLLMKHAGTLTEIQLRLYCPSLFKD